MPDAESLFSTMPLARQLGIAGEAAEQEEVRARLAFRESNCTAGGAVHGGALMALADSTGAVLAVLNLPDGATTATIESKTNFLRAARGDVVAVARPLHVGGTVIVVQTDIVDAQGRRVAQTTQTQAVIRPR